MRLDSNIKQKSPNNTYLNNIKIFIKLFKTLKIIESLILIRTLTFEKQPNLSKKKLNF